MSNIQNQKSGLAKLMATENFIVQHAKVRTASFDPKNRVLTCPIWEQMSGDLYDLLMGHEVGHAIDTPADGWHGTVHDRGVNYKTFLNVVEDARIEKRQKRRYPGLRRSFTNGFNELMDKDFFGLNGRDYNHMTFIDRLNLYTKSSYTLPVAFNAIEQAFVDRVQACETWDDVLKVTNEIWDYSKEEQSKTQLPQDNFHFGSDGDDDDSETGSNEGDAETDGQGNKKSKSKQKGDDGNPEPDFESKASSDDEKGDEENDDEGEDGNQIVRNKESQSVNQDQTSEPRCETDENFRNNESKLIAKHAREYKYIEIPKPNLSQIVTSAKRVQELLTGEFTKQRPEAYQTIANNLYNDFRRKNERFVSLLAKEFEMRKAADKFSKAKTSATGDIDVSRIFKYQIDDNIFKKVMCVPKGKSHGLILLIDKSGSMSDNLSASYEQILILAMFCRKVNIPFSAYGFGNADHVRFIDFPEEATRDYSYKRSLGCFSEKPKELSVSSVYLREMINSKMSNSEFSKAVKNLLCLMDAWSHRNFYRPSTDSLSNTPMTEALIACQPLINEFRATNNLDIVNLCLVHDGDADDIKSYYGPNDVDTGLRSPFNSDYQNVFLCDKKNKVQEELRHGDDSVRIAICNWLTKTTGAKIIGFYLANQHAIKGALRRRLFNAELDELHKDERKNYYALKDAYTKYGKIVRKDKFIESKNPGYESFFILPGGSDLSVDNEDFEAPSKINTANLTKAFSKFTKNRQVNRVLVSRFIDIIAV